MERIHWNLNLAHQSVRQFPRVSVAACQELTISEIVRYYGKDLNKKSLQNALFRHFNPIVKQLQVEADGTGTYFCNDLTFLTKVQMYMDKTSIISPLHCMAFTQGIRCIDYSYWQTFKSTMARMPLLVESDSNLPLSSRRMHKPSAMQS